MSFSPVLSRKESTTSSQEFDQATACSFQDLPKTWLLRFATIIPFTRVNLLMRVCKRFRQHLRHNTAWKEQCASLPAYQSLVQSEIDGLQPENFWYSWYISKCIRKLKVRLPILHPKMRQSKRPDDVISVMLPRVGSLLSQPSSPHYEKSKVYVVVRVLPGGSKLNPDAPMIFYIAKAFEDFDVILMTGFCTFVRSDEYKICMRDNGSLNLKYNIMRPEDYVLQ